MPADDRFWVGVERRIEALLATPWAVGAGGDEEREASEFWTGVDRLVDRALAVPWREVADAVLGDRPRTQSVSPSRYPRPPVRVHRRAVYEGHSRRVRDEGAPVPGVGAVAVAVATAGATVAAVAPHPREPAAAFRGLEGPLADAMRSTLRQLVARGATGPDADDAVQEALVAVLRRPELLDESNTTRAALLRIALLKYRRASLRARLRRLHEVPVAELPDAAVPDEGESEEVVVRAVLREALAGVSAQQRRYMYLVAIEGRSVEDIAASSPSNLTSQEIRGLLATARKKLRQAYADVPP